MHSIVPIANIRLRPGRQRQSFDESALLTLAQSIRDRGLIHALVIDREGYLVSGERRLRAINQHILPLRRPLTYGGNALPEGCVPTLVAFSNDPLELEELELAENRDREDLTWQEEAEANARLLALRTKQHAAKIAALPGNTLVADVPPPPTPATVAQEVYGKSEGWYQTNIRQAAVIVDHLHRPEVAKAPTLREAFKALQKIEAADRTKALATAIGSTFSARSHILIQGNCLEILRRWDRVEGAPQFDVILTDPPYGVDADTFGDAAGRLTTLDHEYEDSQDNWLATMGEWCNLSYQVAKPQAHCYVFCDIENFLLLRAMMQEAGWYVFRTPLTYYKPRSGRVPLPDRGPRRHTEWILYAIKGEKKTNYIGEDLIIADKDEKTEGHGAQKSVPALVELLRRSVEPGMAVLDSFAGSGTTVSAAHSLLCSCTLIEQSPTYYGQCLERVANLVDPKP